MKHVRVYVAIALIAAAMLIIPISLTFATEKLTDAQMKAISDCKTKRAACVAGCSLQYGPTDGPNRLSRYACDQQCKETYLTCVFSVRRASTTNEPGQGSHPQIAPPPTATPRKISPQSVGDVGKGGVVRPAAQTASATPPPRKPIDRGSASTSANISTGKSPTPAPRKKKQ